MNSYLGSNYMLSFTEIEVVQDVEPKCIAHTPYSPNRLCYLVDFVNGSTSYKWRNHGDFSISISDWRYWPFADFSKRADFGHLGLVLRGYRRKFKIARVASFIFILCIPSPKISPFAPTVMAVGGGDLRFSCSISCYSSLSVIMQGRSVSA